MYEIPIPFLQFLFSFKLTRDRKLQLNFIVKCCKPSMSDNTWNYHKEHSCNYICFFLYCSLYL